MPRTNKEAGKIINDIFALGFKAGRMMKRKTLSEAALTLYQKLECGDLRVEAYANKRVKAEKTRSQWHVQRHKHKRR